MPTKSQSTEAGSGSKIVNCSCRNEYQDKRYGKANRVANQNKDRSYTCSVCGTNFK